MAISNMSLLNKASPLPTMGQGQLDSLQHGASTLQAILLVLLREGQCWLRWRMVYRLNYVALKNFQFVLPPEAIFVCMVCATARGNADVSISCCCSIPLMSVGPWGCQWSVLKLCAVLVSMFHAVTRTMWKVQTAVGCDG